MLYYVGELHEDGSWSIIDTTDGDQMPLEEALMELQYQLDFHPKAMLIPIIFNQE